MFVVGFSHLLSVRLASMHEVSGLSLSGSLSWCFTNVRCFGELSMVLLQLKDPIGSIAKRRTILPNSMFLSRRDMT